MAPDRKPGGSGTRSGRRGRTPGSGAPAADRPPEQDADPEAVARRICLQQLERAPRTRTELQATLGKRGVPDDVTEHVLGRFAEVGLIDDALFAQLWVTTRHRGRGLAGRALSQELRRKGIDEDLVREAVGELDPAQELATAQALVARKVPATAGLAPDARVRRLAGMLARKGYPAGLAFRVVRDALENEGQDTGLVPEGEDGCTAHEADAATARGRGKRARVAGWPPHDKELQ